jgi:hypothetical protein
MALSIHHSHDQCLYIPLKLSNDMSEVRIADVKSDLVLHSGGRRKELEGGHISIFFLHSSVMIKIFSI